MRNLKNKLFFIILPFLLMACQSTPVFDIKTFPAPPKTKLDDHHLIRIKSNRIKQECLFLNAEAENKWRHQYFIYLLTDKNEVLPIMHAINQEGSVCKEQLKKIQKILNQESEVKICAQSELTKEIKEDERFDRPIEFGPLGSHQVVYDALFLDSICNSKNCFIYDEASACLSNIRKSD